MRNAKQGNIGRQLGVTKVFDIKNKMNQVKVNLSQQMTKVTEEKQITDFKSQIQEFTSLVTKIEQLEKELSMLEEEEGSNQHDTDLQEGLKSLNTNFEQSKKTLENFKK